MTLPRGLYRWYYEVVGKQPVRSKKNMCKPKGIVKHGRPFVNHVLVTFFESLRDCFDLKMTVKTQSK